MGVNWQDTLFIVARRVENIYSDLRELHPEIHNKSRTISSESHFT